MIQIVAREMQSLMTPSEWYLNYYQIPCYFFFGSYGSNQLKNVQDEPDSLHLRVMFIT